MTENIQYVGGQHQISSHLSSNKLSNKVHLREKQRKMGRYQNSNHKVNHNSRSTSCPKTERSSYAITLQKLRNRSPRLQLNILNILKAKESAKTETKVLTAKNSSSNQYSSAFERISMRPVQKEKSKQKKLFKKVQQPRFRSKQHCRMNDFNEYRAYTTQNKQQNQQKLGNIKPTISNTKQINTQTYQTQSLCQLQVDQHYKIQPLKKLFLCNRCYQFTPIIELRAHHLSCHIPLNKEQFVQKWLKIINLLKEILRQKNTNQIYRLIDRMEWYISECKIGHRQGYILYSQELACVLSLKESIKLDCVYVDDLFSLIETVGDLIETKSIDLDQTAFWKMCH